MTKFKSFNTYSRKKSFKTLSRTVILRVNEAPKTHVPALVSDDEDDYCTFVEDDNCTLNDKNQQVEEEVLHNLNRPSFYDFPITSENELSTKNGSDMSENCALELKQEEWPPKKRNTGRRVLKMKSNCISRHEHMTDGMHKVSLKDSERIEVNAPVIARNPINHAVSKVSNTYASITRSYVETNET